MRLVTISILSVMFSACAVSPQQEVALLTDAYQEVDQSARAIYAKFNVRGKVSALGNTGGIERFSPAYILVLDDYIDEAPETEEVGLSERYAALDSMLAFNDAMSGLAAGRCLEEVKASLAPLSTVLGSAFEPTGALSIEGISPLIDAIEQAQTREDLIDALQQEISVSVPDRITGQPKTYRGHPTLVLLKLLEEDVRDMKLIVRARAAQKFTEMTDQMRQNPDPASLAARATVVEDAKAFMETLSDFRDLLTDTQEYFALLRHAALNQNQILQTTEFISVALDMAAQAKALIK
ncbi:hypothetical protein [Litchfieldella rifensis]|uniref:Uncharacterized protein n=1 Tax=Litchfieldella rifensis TaxID=762643 RepID=A0ABV7LI75_9GAMM